MHPGRFLPNPHLLRPLGGGQGQEAPQRALQPQGGVGVGQRRLRLAGEPEVGNQETGGRGSQEQHVLRVMLNLHLLFPSTLHVYDLIYKIVETSYYAIATNELEYT